MTAYLDYAGVGRLGVRAQRAMRAVLDEVLPGGSVGFARLFAAREEARAGAARLLECEPDEIALVPNTSTGLHLVADGISWRPGDEVVVFDRDFPANVHPWRRLAAAGVRLRWVPMRAGGYRQADVAALVGPATRLIAVSHVNFRTGFRIDLDAVCGLAAAAGALVCVDAAQSLGVLPLSMTSTRVDFLAAGGHKWLCAPPGTGIFFCRRERLDLLAGAPAGWFGYQGAADIFGKGGGHFSYDLPLWQAARRFEGGMPPFLEIAGLAAALAELADTGLAAVSARVRLLTAALREGVRARGYTVVSPDGPDAWSGIVAFAHPAGDAAASHAYAALSAAGCCLSYPDGVLRAAPHYWTTDAAIDTVLRALPVATGPGG
jgi:selenocysteine lyase/cysteine desulfurase